MVELLHVPFLPPRLDLLLLVVSRLNPLTTDYIPYKILIVIQCCHTHETQLTILLKLIKRSIIKRNKKF